MFTGIIESLGTVKNIVSNGTNIDFSIESNLTKELKIDQSVAHNGVCLTVTNINNNVYDVTAIKETLDKTNLNNLKVESKVNLERCLQYNGRIDGHIVQGHVDCTAIITEVHSNDGSWKFTFELPNNQNNLLVDKGSVTINGVSLTVVNPVSNRFSVAIIPYTYEHTVFHTFKKGTEVNIEFDILGKYVQQNLKSYTNA